VAWSMASLTRYSLGHLMRRSRGNVRDGYGTRAVLLFL
jgi:hypothetical protein